MKKIVIMAPALVTGGAETMIVRLAKSIDKEKFDVAVVCLTDPQDTVLERDLNDSGVPVYYLGKSKSASWRTLFDAYKLLSKLSPNIVHGHISGTVYAVPWILLRNRVLVHTVHTRPDMEFTSKFRLFLKVLAKLKKLVIVAVSEENRIIAKEHYGLSDNCFCVNNPVEVSRYYKKERADNEVRFINVSRQDVNKNQIMILRAFAKIYNEYQNSRLILVGDGNQHGNLIAEASRLGLSEAVTFTGEISNPEDYLAVSDIYISVSHIEGLPLSMLEAMSAKLPVISSNVGGCPDIVKDNGILFDDGDEEQLLDAMRRLISSKDLRTVMGNRSFEIASSYDVKECASSYQKIYEKFSKGC